MESILKSYLGFFFLMLLTLSGMGIVLSSAEARNAESFLHHAIHEISSADDMEEAIAQMKEDADERGYGLKVHLTEEAHLIEDVSLTEDVPPAEDEPQFSIAIAKSHTASPPAGSSITITYPFRLLVFGLQFPITREEYFP